MKSLMMIVLASGVIALAALFGRGSDVAFGATVDIEILAFDVVDPRTGLITDAITIHAGHELPLVFRETIRSTPAAQDVDDNMEADPVVGKYTCKKKTGESCHWVNDKGKKFAVDNKTKIVVTAAAGVFTCTFDPPGAAASFAFTPCKVAVKNVKSSVPESAITLDITGNTWLPSVDEIGTHVFNWTLEAIPGPGDVDSNPANNFATASVTVTVTSPEVGGTTELLVGDSDAPSSASDGSGGWFPYAAVAAAGALAIAAGGWYARRRWLQG